ncbi:MAG: DUF1499 domain-containing protein [Planctomycetaceae bacterium]
MKRRLPIICVLLSAAMFAGLLMMNWFSKPPSNLGVSNGKLAACPESPNGVRTQAARETQKMEPISFTGDTAAVMERIKTVVGSTPRTRITEESETYLRSEFTTAIMRFIDDVEFFIDEDAKLIHFRSASRIGYSDMNANRKRMTELVKKFREMQL